MNQKIEGKNLVPGNLYWDTLVMYRNSTQLRFVKHKNSVLFFDYAAGEDSYIIDTESGCIIFNITSHFYEKGGGQ